MEMVALREQAADDLTGGVVGIGDEVVRLCDRHGPKQHEHLVEQGAPIAIGPEEAFVDAYGERDGEDALGGPNQQAHGLKGVPHDVFGFGVGVGLLMQPLHSRQLLAALGDLEPVADEDAATIDEERRGEQPQGGLRPQRRETIELDGESCGRGGWRLS